METSRTENVARNMIFNAPLQIVTILLGFWLRTVFIYTLGKDYLGINGLFTNILTILSLAELGIGDAIMFSLYKPMAQNDPEKVKSIMQLYRKAYQTVGIVIAVAGLAIIPFLGLLIADKPNIYEDLRLIYCLFLANTVISYFLSYKKDVITADQKNYIVFAYKNMFLFLQILGQTIVLYLTHNYIAYLIMMIACTFLNNYFISRKADRLYPYLTEKDVTPLKRDEKQTIFANVKALIVYKLGTVVLEGTNNIVICAILGISLVGVVSNYTLIIGTVLIVLLQIMEAFTASIGNLNAVSDRAQQELVFNKFLFISEWLYGFCSIALLLFLNMLIDLWIGKEYLLSPIIVFALVLHFFIKGIQFVPFTFRTTMGLFDQAKAAPVIAAALNLGLSIILAYRLGLFGVFLATSIARFFTMGIIDPWLIYKRFNKSPYSYYAKYFGYLLLTFLNYCFSYWILSLIPLNGWIGLFVKAFTCLLVTNLFYYLAFSRTVILKEIQQSVVNLLMKRFYSKAE